MVEFICDGCGKREPGSFGPNGNANIPANWYIRGDEDGTQVSCSRQCIEVIAEKTKKTSVVLPI